MAEPQRILLTGATGYVGAATLKAFAAMGKIEKVTAVVRNADRAKEAVELGAQAVLLAPDVTELPASPALLAPFDCVVNTANLPLAVTENYTKEAKLAEDMVAFLKARPGGGTYVHCTGLGAVGNAHARDGAKAGEYTDWSELKPVNRPGTYEPGLRHAGEKATVLADTSATGGTLRTAVVRPGTIYGGDGRSDVSVQPYFRDAEEHGAPRVNGTGSGFSPLVHVDDVGDLLARVALTPTARGIFHAAEAGAKTAETNWTTAELAKACSEAAGKGGKVNFERPPPAGPPRRAGQTCEIENSLSIGWKPRVFDAKVEYAAYLKAKGTARQLVGATRNFFTQEMTAKL